MTRRRRRGLIALLEAIVIALFVGAVILGACVLQVVFYPSAADAEVLTAHHGGLQR